MGPESGGSKHCREAALVERGSAYLSWIHWAAVFQTQKESRGIWGKHDRKASLDKAQPMKAQLFGSVLIPPNNLVSQKPMHSVRIDRKRIDRHFNARQALRAEPEEPSYMGSSAVAVSHGPT